MHGDRFIITVETDGTEGTSNQFRKTEISVFYFDLNV